MCNRFDWVNPCKQIYDTGMHVTSLFKIKPFERTPLTFSTGQCHKLFEKLLHVQDITVSGSRNKDWHCAFNQTASGEHITR